MRRVVTGIDQDGRSIVVSDGDLPGHRFVHIPGMRATTLWATRHGPIDHSGLDPVPRLDHDVPTVGETRFHVIELPPDAVYASPDFDPELASAEQRAVSPELAGLFEPDSPGTHTTPTVDYVLIMQGSIELELDNDVPVRLSVGDTVVMNGVRHAWRNRSDTPCSLLITWVAPTA